MTQTPSNPLQRLQTALSDALAESARLAECAGETHLDDMAAESWARLKAAKEAAEARVAELDGNLLHRVHEVTESVLVETRDALKVPHGASIVAHAAEVRALADEAGRRGSATSRPLPLLASRALDARGPRPHDGLVTPRKPLIVRLTEGADRLHRILPVEQDRAAQIHAAELMMEAADEIAALLSGRRPPSAEGQS